MKNIKGYEDVLNEAESQEVLNRMLLYAAQEGNLSNVKDLLDRGAEIDARNESGWTPLSIAAAGGHTDIARLLLHRGAEIDARNKSDSTPLHFAAAYGRTETAKLLLDRGAEVDVRNNLGSTPLHWAAAKGRTETAKLLIQHGADPLKAFDGPEDVLKFFNGDISWMPEELKVKLKRMQRGKSAFGM